MKNYLPRNSAALLVLIVIVTIASTTGFPLGKRLYRSLPSVSDDHYSEVFPDGTYKYAYTGENRYAAERKKRSGQVEGETLYIRPDGVPVKVHYFADSNGYRPKQEILYRERVVPARTAPVVHYALPDRSSSSVRLSSNNNQNDVAVGSSGGDVAIAQPSITAIVGPGGHADIRPEAVARSGSSSGARYYRNGGFSDGGSDVAIANPSVNAVVGPGASVSIAPRATAITGDSSPPVVVHERSYAPVREVHHHHPPTVVREHVPVPVPVVTERHYGDRTAYVYAPPRARVPVDVVHPAPVFVDPLPVHSINAIRSHGVVVVPPRPSYEYSYGYSSPDEKHPSFGPNSAYVNVKVNSK